MFTFSILCVLFQEQRELLECGYKRRADDMEEDIRKLKSDQKEAQEKKESPSFWGKVGSGLATAGRTVSGWFGF